MSGRPAVAAAEQPTITVGRTEYRIERHADSDEMPYTLHGPRGATTGVATSRSATTCLWSMGGASPRARPDWWFTDDGGELRLA